MDPLPPVIDSSLEEGGTKDIAFTYTITATNAPTTFDASGLPDGLVVNTETGDITGTPLELGEFEVTISATNEDGTGSDTLILTIIDQPPVLTSADEVGGIVGAPFLYRIRATRSHTEYSADDLPAGLVVDTETGDITGRPEAAGTTEVTIGVVNSGGTDSKPIDIVIVSGSTPQPQVRTALLQHFMEPEDVQLTYDWKIAEVGELSAQHHCLFVATGGTIEIKERAGGDTLAFTFADGTFFPVRIHEIVSLGTAAGVLVGKMAEVSGAQI